MLKAQDYIADLAGREDGTTLPGMICTGRSVRRLLLSNWHCCASQNKVWSQARRVGSMSSSPRNIAASAVCRLISLFRR